MPMVTEAPMLLNRFHASPNKRFGLGDVTSVAGGVVGDVTSVAGQGAAVATSVGAEAASAVQSVAGAVETGLAHLVDEAKDALEEIVDDLADELYKKLGIQQFYSIHLTDMCFGNFTPSATADNAGFGVVNCTAPLNWTAALDLTGMLNQSLGVGPFQLSLGDIGLVQDVVDAIDKVMKVLNQCLEAILSFYILGALFSFISMALCVWAVFALRFPHPQDMQQAGEKGYGVHDDSQRKISRRIKYTALYSNLFAAWAATSFLFIGNMITTLGGKYAVDTVSEHGGDFGLYAYRGSKFLAMSWAAFALVLLTAALWTFECTKNLLRKTREVRQARTMANGYSSDTS